MLGLDDNFKAMRDANRSTAEEQFDEIHRNILNRDITFIDDKWELGYDYPVVSPDILFYDGSHSYEETRDILQYCITMLMVKYWLLMIIIIHNGKDSKRQ